MVTKTTGISLEQPQFALFQLVLVTMADIDNDLVWVFWDLTTTADKKKTHKTLFPVECR